MLITLIMMLAAGLVGGWIAGARRGAASSDKEISDLRERMLRLEQSVENMSGEMERVSEGQRFLTALLEERARSQIGVKPPTGGGEAGE